MPGHPTLQEYADARPMRHGLGAWFESLPEDVQKQAIEGWKAGLGQTIILEWLQSLGFEGATKGRVHAYLSAKYPRKSNG